MTAAAGIVSSHGASDIYLRRHRFQVRGIDASCVSTQVIHFKRQVEGADKPVARSAMSKHLDASERESRIEATSNAATDPTPAAGGLH